MTRSTAAARAYRGPYPIRSHRTLADLGFGDPATLRPVVIGLDLGRSPDIQVVQVIDGQHRVIGQRFRSHADDQPCEDLRELQRQWDAEERAAEAQEAIRAQFRAVNAAMQRPQGLGLLPANCPPVIAWTIAIASLVGGAALVGGVMLYTALAVRLIGGQ